MPTKKAATTVARRDARGRYLPGASANPATKFQPGHKYRFQPGVSGNPAGVPARRALFEKLFYDALMGQGSPDEAARLLWECARKKEPWAVQLLLQRVAPESSKVKLEVTRGQDEIDFSKLNDRELDALEQILERARPVAAIESGAGTAQTGDVH